MKKLLSIITLISILVFTACSSKQSNKTEIMKLSDVKRIFLETGDTEEITENLLGVHRDDIIASWGEPDGMLSGLWGDIWFDKDSEIKIIVYYCTQNIENTVRGTVEEVLIYTEKQAGTNNQETIVTLTPSISPDCSDSTTTNDVSMIPVEAGNETYDSIYLTLEDVPKEFVLADAMKSNMFVLSESEIVHGQELWDSFLAKTKKGEAASLLIAYNYELGDKSHYSEEYYEEIKDDYPVLYVKELIFDGSQYEIHLFDDNGEIIVRRGYEYMIHTSGKLNNAAVGADGYYLVHDETLTYQQLMWSLLSSNSKDWIDFQSVYDVIVR